MSEPISPEAQAEIAAATTEVDYLANLRAASSLRTASSVLFDRYRFASMAGVTFGGHRDLYQILGYKRILTYSDYRDRYARDGIAQAIVDAYPAATWRGGVELYEDEDPQTDTEFERAFKELDQRLGFWQRLQQVDTLAGLSTFAVLLIGNGDSDLTTELTRGGTVKFLKPFSGGGGPIGIDRGWGVRSTAFDAAVSVAEYDTDPTSERYGEPKFYDIRAVGTSNPNMVGRRVHWSRMIHVAEGCLEDDVYGTPVLEAVWNLLDDLAKVTGGGAEAHWLRANQGLHLNVDPKMGLPSTTPGKPSVPGLSTDERQALRDKAEEMSHQLQRVLVTRGVEVNQLGSDVASFGNNADAILKQIAGAKKIPMRILTGSEMGTLASEQDAANFDSRVQDRRTGYAGPRLVRRTIDRLIKYGYLPTPKQYEVGWPVEENMDEVGKAGFAVKLASVNSTYGSVVFTDDEIRDMAFDKPPLTPEQKQPAEQPAPPAPLPEEQLLAAEMRALEAAIEANDVDAVARLVGLGDVEGHEFHGNQYTVMFHGTPAENLDSILAKGIRSSAISSHASSTFDAARVYADRSEKKGRKAVVLELHVPAEHVKKMRADSTDFVSEGRKDHLFTRYDSDEGFKPEWIKSVHERVGGTWKTTRHLQHSYATTRDEGFGC